MSSPFVAPNHANLYVLRPQDGSDESLFASIGADMAVSAGGHVEGEFVKAETVASAVPGTGRRCLDMRTAIVLHDPGVMSERIALDVMVHAADAYIRQAGQPAADIYAQTLSLLEQDAGPATVATLAADTLSAIDRITMATIQQAGADEDPSALVQSVMDANVAPAAAEAVTSELQRTRAALLKRARARDGYDREARPDHGQAVTRALSAWISGRVMALDQIERRGQDEVDANLARANEAAAEMPPADANGASPRRGVIKDRVWAFLFSEAEATPAATPTPASDVRASLRGYLRARLMAAAANQLRLALAAAGAGAAAGPQRGGRLADLVAMLSTRAKDAAAALDEQSDERMRRATGLFLPASADIRAALAQEVMAAAGDTLVNRLIREPLVASQAFEEALQYEHFEDAVLAAARGLTAGLREDSLAQLMARLSPAALDNIAKRLASAEPTLTFRPGYPVPQVLRRIAVPDGPNGPLGMAIRRRFTGIDVGRCTDPLLAFGVAVTEVFSVDQLEAYHGRWGKAREDARAAGIDRRLVSDRRLLDVEDGLTTNRDLDAFIIRGVVCGSVASSKEPPAVDRAYGTWYLMPAGQLLRPSQIDPARLDAVFNGYCLGRSLAEIRTTLRHAPQHRHAIDERWQLWCNEHSIEQRAAQIDVVMDNLLPSDELAAACRQLKNTLTRELRLRIEV